MFYPYTFEKDAFFGIGTAVKGAFNGLKSGLGKGQGFTGSLKSGWSGLVQGGRGARADWLARQPRSTKPGMFSSYWNTLTGKGVARAAGNANYQSLYNAAKAGPLNARQTAQFNRYSRAVENAQRAQNRALLGTGIGIGAAGLGAGYMMGSPSTPQYGYPGMYPMGY